MDEELKLALLKARQAVQELDELCGVRDTDVARALFKLNFAFLSGTGRISREAHREPESTCPNPECDGGCVWRDGVTEGCPTCCK